MRRRRDGKKKKKEKRERNEEMSKWEEEEGEMRRKGNAPVAEFCGGRLGFLLRSIVGGGFILVWLSLFSSPIPRVTKGGV
jgi:hypothetical protein